MRVIEEHEIETISGGLQMLDDAARALGGATARAIDAAQSFWSAAQVGAHSNWV